MFLSYLGLKKSNGRSGINRSAEHNDELLLHLVRVTTSLSSVADDQQMARYDNSLCEAIEKASPEARKETAKSVADLKRGPSALIQKIAHDRFDVAEPVIRQSLLLTEEDTIKLIKSGTDKHVLAIANRPKLSESETAEIIERAERVSCRDASKNEGAKFSAQSFKTLVEMARRDHDIGTNLSLRRDLDLNTARDLNELPSVEIKRNIREKGYLEKIRSAQSNSSRQSDLGASFLSRFDFVEAEIRMSKILKKGAISEVVIRSAAKEDRFDDLLAYLSQLAGVSLTLVQEIFTQTNPQKGTMLCVAAGLSEETFKQVLSCGFWREYLTTDKRSGAIKIFRSTNAQTAKQTLTEMAQPAKKRRA